MNLPFRIFLFKIFICLESILHVKLSNLNVRIKVFQRALKEFYGISLLYYKTYTKKREQDHIQLKQEELLNPAMHTRKINCLK